MIYTELFHGHDTHTEDHQNHTVFFNKDFPEDEYYNFLAITKTLEDIDLFEIIHEENPKRIVLKNRHNQDLLESLNYSLEDFYLYEVAKTLPKAKKFNYIIKEADNLKAYQNYRDSYTDPKIEEKYFKAKKNRIILVLDGEEIIASMILNLAKDWVEIHDLYVLESYRNQSVASNLIRFAQEYNPRVRTLVEENYLPKEFRLIESLTEAYK